MRIGRSAALAACASLLLLLAVGCQSAGRAPLASVDLGFPSPLAGPGHPQIDSRSKRQVERGWAALLSGRLTDATAAAAKAGESDPARLLAAQIALVEKLNPSDELRDIVSRHPDYAAAVLTLSVAQEKANDERASLETARRGANLWDVRRWRQRVANLEDRWVGERLASGREALSAGDTKRARELAAAVLRVESDNREAHLLDAEALVASGSLEEADPELDALGNDPEAIVLRGQIAEKRDDWTTAMSLYESLPPNHPRRAELLDRARRRWRLANMPQYVQKAIDSPDLTRAQLAVLLVALAPQVESLPATASPLLTDIVELPGHREIVVAVRAGLIDTDEIEHRFFPDREAEAETVRTAIDRLCKILDKDAPAWCSSSVTVPTCVQLGKPVTGHEVADLVLQIMEGGSG
ncbi:MAG: hypothetical protein LJE95_10495 [Acidobacteria bacterium]|nr:hypothetical protein [Acidobacteriota bacterium]